MQSLFQSRAFIAATLMLLVGAVRCINACEFTPAPPPAAAAPAGSCHHHNPEAPPAPDVKTCGHLNLAATPAGPDVGPPMVIAEPPPVVFAPLLAHTTIAAPLGRLAWGPPGASHPLPLRI